MKTKKQNFNGSYIKASQEAYDLLVDGGYAQLGDINNTETSEYIAIDREDDLFFFTSLTAAKKQFYINNGALSWDEPIDNLNKLNTEDEKETMKNKKQKTKRIIMCKLTPQDIENAKQLIVNLEVSKTMDSKTNTRRLPKFELLDDENGIVAFNKMVYSPLLKKYVANFTVYSNDDEFYERDFAVKPKYQIGDVRWIREPVQVTRFDDILQQYDYQYVSDGQNVYQADIPKKYKGQNNPKWMKNLNRVPNGCLKTMARTFIKITNVRVERLREIHRSGMRAEGCPENIKDGKTLPKMTPTLWWINLWNSTAPKGYKWGDNPYVFVYEFERVEK